MSKNITVERHDNGWCLKDAQGNCLIVTPDRTGLDRILQQMSVSQATDKLHAARHTVAGAAGSNLILALP